MAGASEQRSFNVAGNVQAVTSDSTHFDPGGARHVIVSEQVGHADMPDGDLSEHFRGRWRLFGLGYEYFGAVRIGL